MRTNRATVMALTLGMMVVAMAGGPMAMGQAPLAPDIENTSGKYPVWGDYKIELNQYGGLGRNWPTPDLVWEQHAILSPPRHVSTLPDLIAFHRSLTNRVASSTAKSLN